MDTRRHGQKESLYNVIKHPSAVQFEINETSVTLNRVAIRNLMDVYFTDH
jgi:hypothetical protein